MYLQRTVKHEIECSRSAPFRPEVSMKIKPAEVDEGITFIRTDLPDHHRIKADITNVCDTTLATSIATTDRLFQPSNTDVGFLVAWVLIMPLSSKCPRGSHYGRKCLPFVKYAQDGWHPRSGRCKKLW